MAVQFVGWVVVAPSIAPAANAGPASEQASAEAAEKASGAAHHLLSSRIWLFSSSNVELALAT